MIFGVRSNHKKNFISYIASKTVVFDGIAKSGKAKILKFVLQNHGYTIHFPCYPKSDGHGQRTILQSYVVYASILAGAGERVKVNKYDR